MFNDRFAQLMTRQLAGEATEEEIRELQLFIRQNPPAHYFFEVFTEYWKVEPKTFENNIQEEIQFQQILSIAEKKEEVEPEDKVEVESKEKSKVFSIRKLLVAAVLLGVIVTGYFLLRPNTKTITEKPLGLIEVEAKPSVRTYLLLPDGSKVWLNSASRIEYAKDFNDSIRSVFLEGEAYFDVVKDKTKPFIVHTSDIDIRVLGTAFNIKSYPKESSIETTLIHGLIEVTNKRDLSAPKVILHPHDKLIFNKEESKPGTRKEDMRPMAVHSPYSISSLPKNIPDSSVVETAWTHNKLVFDGETFREIASKMERWYNVTINFKSEKVASATMHASFENETIEEALKALQFIEPFRYKINGNEIEIFKK